MPFSLASLYLDSAKLCALKRIFDIVCQEAAIPLSAKAERDELARAIIRASYSTDSDLVLLNVARRAVGCRIIVSIILLIAFLYFPLVQSFISLAPVPQGRRRFPKF
jgi:hypothetical protein